MKSILTVTHSYPLNLAAYKAKFIQDQVLLFKNSTKFNVEVLNLTPKNIPYTHRFKQQKSGYKLYGESVYHQSYVSVPRRKLPSFIQSQISNAILKFLTRASGKKKYDIIHLHWLYPGGLVIKSLKKAGYRVALTIHGSDWYKNIHTKGLQSLLKQGLELADQILVSGPNLEKDITQMYPHLKNKILLVYNFVDSSIYTLPTVKQKTNAQQSLKFNPTKINFLTVASLREVKGIDTLIEAIKHIKNDSFHFHIAGPIENTPFANDIVNTIKTDNLSNKVTLHGQVKPLELVKYYHASDAYILPSRNEGFNLSLLEATATGLPAIATDVGGNKEVLPSKSGIIVQPENGISLAAAINEVSDRITLFDPNFIADSTLSRFSESSMLTRLEKIYSDNNFS